MFVATSNVTANFINFHQALDRTAIVVSTPYLGYEDKKQTSAFSLVYKEKETKARLPEEEKIEIFQNLLVPKHVLLTKEETTSVLNKYKIKPYQLPDIKSWDPAARAIDAQPGDVVKIIRGRQTAGSAIAYRYVVEG